MKGGKIMERKPVESSTIKSVGYDAEMKALEVEFASGRIYQYYDVPEEIHNEFISAPSKGNFFHHKIKNQGFPFKRIEQEVQDAHPEGRGPSHIRSVR
jgi:hypothetical protein